MTDKTLNKSDIATMREWKQFDRIKGSYSLWHLCDSENNTVCGWIYEPHEYTKIIKSKEMPNFAVCNLCAENKMGDGIMRNSIEFKVR